MAWILRGHESLIGEWRQLLIVADPPCPSAIKPHESLVLAVSLLDDYVVAGHLSHFTAHAQYRRQPARMLARQS
jgi:hypothetical protein